MTPIHGPLRGPASRDAAPEGPVAPAEELVDLARAVISAASCVVVVVDAMGRIVRFNEAAELLTGWSKHEVVGQLFREIFPPPPEQLDPRVRAELRSGQT